jgi:hypothetical protein
MADHIPNYNLPPSFTTNKFFLMLVLLILGNESVNNDNIDVCLVPLVRSCKSFGKEWMFGMWLVQQDQKDLLCMGF